MGVVQHIAGYLDGIGERWIGWYVPPVQRAFADAEWQRDSRDAYCGSCGLSAGPGEVRESGCAACRVEPHLGDGIVRLGPYASHLRDWILRVKYGRWAEMAEALGQQLGEAVAEADVVDLNRAVVVPMPMPWQRRMYRGIDHAGVIAASAARALDIEVAACLARRNGPPMMTLSATERLAMGKRGLSVRRRWGGWNLDDVDAIVVDDVRTTGASLRGAIGLLRKLKARRVVAAVVAVADESARRGSDMTPKVPISREGFSGWT